MASTKLTALKAKKASKPGFIGDGNGLYLKVGKVGGKSWVFRWRDRGTSIQKMMGLGPYPTISLADARTAAHNCQKVLTDGLDPILEREKDRSIKQAEIQAASNVVTFDMVAAEFIQEILAPDCKEGKTAKTIPQWESSLKAYVTPVFGSKAVGEISTDDVLSVLKPIWKKKPETADRVRMRIERVLAYAAATDKRSKDLINPGIWRGHLDALLPKKQAKKKRQHFSALPYDELPSLYAELCDKESLSALALRWTILTACRTGEAIGAKWAEIDNGVWSIPAERMKAGKLHRIPLSGEATKVLNQLDDSRNYVFPGGNHGKLSQPMSNNAMLSLLKMMRPGYTTHGMRSGFRDWAAETTDYQNFVVEMCLAHVVGGVEGAYRRGDLLEKRAALMNDWANFLVKK